MTSTLATALVRGLVDDAAVFPPGSLPLPEAVVAHAAHRRASYAAAIGPLLVPVGDLARTSELVRRGAAPAPVEVAAVARPGTTLDEVLYGLAGADAVVVHVAGVEVPAAVDRSRLLATTVPLAVEVPRGTGQGADLDQVAADRAAGHAVQAKFRTGATPTWPGPDEAELAGFVVAAVERGLPFKLTGGLHQAVRAAHAPATGGPSEEQHGLLNVLLAVHRAIGGGTTADLETVLARRDPDALVGDIRALTPEEVVAVRTTFTAYGCCGVTDPIDDLTALGLLEENRT